MSRLTGLLAKAGGDIKSGQALHSVEGLLAKGAPALHKIDGVLDTVSPYLAMLPPQISGPLAAVVMGIDTADRFAQSKIAAGLPPATNADLHAVAVFHAGDLLQLNPEAMAQLPATVQAVYDAIKQIKVFHDARTARP